MNVKQRSPANGFLCACSTKIQNQKQNSIVSATTTKENFRSIFRYRKWLKNSGENRPGRNMLQPKKKKKANKNHGTAASHAKKVKKLEYPHK